MFAIERSISVLNVLYSYNILAIVGMIKPLLLNLLNRKFLTREEKQAI